MPSQGKVVLQFIPRPPGSIWRAGDGIWKVGGGIWREEQISDNFDFKPENYLWGFEVGSGIIHKINTNTWLFYIIKYFLPIFGKLSLFLKFF